MPDQVTNQIVNFQSKGEKKVAANIEDLSAELVKARAETARLTKEARLLSLNTDQTADEFKQATRVTRDLIRAKQQQVKIERQLRSAIDETGEAAKKQAALERRQLQQAGTRARLYGDVESRTRALTGAVGFVGGAAGARLERKVNIGAEVLASVEAIGLLKQELPQMTANLIESAGGATKLALSAGAFGVAAGAAILVYKSLSEASHEAARETQQWLDAIEQYYDLNPSKLTTEQINEEIKARNDLGSTLSQQATDIYDRIRAEEASQSAFDKVTDKAGLFDDSLEKLRKKYRETTDAINANRDVIALLEGRLGTGAIAANDAAAATETLRKEEEKLAAERTKEIAALLSIEEERAARQLEFDKRALDWTTEQIAKREEQIVLERASLDDVQEYYDRLLADGKLTKDEYDKASQSVTDRLDLLTEETAALNNMKPFVKVREDEKQAIEDAQAALDERVKTIEEERASMDKRADTLRKFIEDSVKFEAERGRQVSEEAADWATKQTRELAKHYDDLADVDRKFYEDRAAIIEDIGDIIGDSNQQRVDELRDNNREAERAAEDHQKNLRSILRDGQRAETKAARALDAVALRDAQEAKQDALDDAEDQYKTEQKRREEDFQERIRLLEREKDERLQDARDRLDELQRNHQRERNERISAFEQKQREEEADRQRSLERERAGWKRQDDERRQNLADQLGVTKDKLGDILDETTTKWGDIETVYSDGMSDLVRITEREIGNMHRAAMGAVSAAITSSPYEGQRLGGPQAPDLNTFGTGLTGFGSPSDTTYAGATARGTNGARSGTQVNATIIINDATDPNRVGQIVQNKIVELAGSA